MTVPKSCKDRLPLSPEMTVPHENQDEVFVELSAILDPGNSRLWNPDEVLQEVARLVDCEKLRKSTVSQESYDQLLQRRNEIQQKAMYRKNLLIKCLLSADPE